jgi:nicotinate-nucleotide pyrophosphorylase (carboxylating)
MNLLQLKTDEIIKAALAEDISYIDLTTDLLIAPESLSDAFFLSKCDGVLAGLDVACRVFELLDGGVKIKKHFTDGGRIKSGDIIAEFRGKTAALLKGERAALNLLGHMSGIATYTAKCVDAVAGTGARVTDTRKTLPGLRLLQKYAVTCGGGFNHRYNLSDAAMLKNNHIDAYGGITAAVEALRGRIGHTASIEVEVRDFAELNEALEAGVRIILLDNMSLADMRKAVKITAGRATLEASGKITLENVREVALTGVDVISMGALTHDVRALDVSMRIK